MSWPAGRPGPRSGLRQRAGTALVALFLTSAARDRHDPLLDLCVAKYTTRVGEDEQVAFNSKARVFCRTYAFLASVLPYSHAPWERLSTFLELLVPKLPAPAEQDLAQGILEAIDIDSYRV